MMTVEERYHRDAEFHQLVDVICAWIEHCQYTPTEVREAAMLAAIHYDQRTLRPLLFDGDSVRKMAPR